MGSSLPPDPAYPNFAVFDNFIQDASYLTGIIAGAMTQSGKLGVVGGFPIPEVNRLIHAFMAGVRETRPDAAFQVAFIGSWFDPPKAKETAFAQIEAGADVMYAERFGVSDAAKERGVLAIGNVIDTQPDYPETVVASALWHFEPTLDAAIAAVQAGQLRGGRLRRLLVHEERRLLAGAARHLRGQGAGGGDGAGRRSARRRSRTAASPSRSTTASRRPPDRGAVTPVVLRLDGVTKRFGPQRRQRRHRLRRCTEGEVIALLGENGAGKTTLMNILFGHYVADEGRVEVMGRELPPGNPRAALAAGVGMVHQHFTLADNLTVLENIVLGTRRALAPGLRQGRAGAHPRPRRPLRAGGRSRRRGSAT